MSNSVTFRQFLLAMVMSAPLVLAGCGGAQARFGNHLARGKQYFSQGVYDKASVEFRNALQIQPKSTDALLWNGLVAEKHGDARAAVAFFQSVIDAAPGNQEARSHLVRIFLLARAYPQAQKLLEPALLTDPNNAGLLALRAAARLQSDDRAGAVADAERALQLDPANEEAIEIRVRIFKDTGDSAAAMRLVSEGIRKHPESTPLREVLVNLAQDAGESAQAEKQLQVLIKQSPRNASHRYQLAGLYSRENRLDEAQRVLEETVDAFPKDNDAKLMLANFVSKWRTPAKGQEVLRGFIAQQPDNYKLRLGLGALLFRNGATKEASEAYQEVVRRDSSGPQGLIARDQLAVIFASQGNYADARKLVGEVLKDSPRDADALTLRGRMALAQNDPAAAIVDLRAVLRDAPQNVAIQQLLAQAYDANGQPALAGEAYHAALDLTPNDVSLRTGYAKFLMSAHQTDKAADVLEEAVRSAPGDAQVRDGLVRAYIAKQDFDAAAKAAEDLKTLQPESSDGWYLAGLAAQGKNHLDEAERQFEHALAMQPGALDTLSALARLELARGRAAKAIALVKNATEKSPTDAYSLNLLGELYMTQREPALAHDAFSRATQLAPKWWVPYRNLAIERHTVKDAPGAVTAYQAAIKVAPTEPKLVTELADIYQSLGRIDEAIECYEAGSRANPRAQTIANNLAMLLVTYRKDARSLDRARDLTAGLRSSEDAVLLDTTGWVHFKRAEYADALSVLQRAAARTPGSREIRYHLGMAELKSGLRDRALVDLEAAVAGAGGFPGADEARTTLTSLKGQAG